MKRATRLLWALSLLLILAGVAAYYFYAATRGALERAENTEIRHMQVARIGDQGGIRFFFATNRQPVPGPEERPLVERYGRERTDDWRLGYFDTLVAPSLGLGRWLDASRWFLEEVIKVLDVQTLTVEQAEMLDSAAGLMDLVAPGDDRVALVDVTPVNRTRNFHNFSLEVPEYYPDPDPALAGPPAGAQMGVPAPAFLPAHGPGQHPPAHDHRRPRGSA